MDETKAAARAAIDEWATTQPFAREGLAERLALKSVEEVGPTRVLLRSRVERRKIETSREPTDEPLRDATRVDLWSVHVPESSDENGGVPLFDLASVERCVDCGGLGTTKCTRCEGTGASGGIANECGRCDGCGATECASCGGKKRIRVTPRIVATRSAEERTRTIENDEELPIPVLLSVQEGAVEGRVIFREAAERIEPGALRGEGGGPYRGGGARLGQEVEAAIADLAATPFGDDVRILSQELEVVRVPIWIVRPKRGRVFWLVGTSPPTIIPPDALQSEERMRSASVVALAVLAVLLVFSIAIAALALRR